MPNPGQANNLSGINGWEGWTQEPPYGEATKQKALAGSAPLAGGQVAAGALNSARRAQRQAVSPKSTKSTAPAGEPAPLPASQEWNPPPSYAQLWADLAATPGFDRYPVLVEMAARARG